ncbi:hypothetical protein AAG906_010504 [Vitis piasezkii]
MMGWDGEAPQPISLYEDSDFSGYTHGQQVPRPFRLALDEIPRWPTVSPVYLQHVPPLTPFILFPKGALSQIRVDTATTLEGLIHFLTVDRATCIMFFDNDLPPEGSNHVRPLFIDVACLGRRVSSILLDNGSALNVCPLRTFMGTLTAHVMIGSVRYSVLFQVLRIQSSFNLLLGHPWIHEVGSIPYSLHQKVKFIHEGRIIMIQFGRNISHSEDDLHLTGLHSYRGGCTLHGTTAQGQISDYDILMDTVIDTDGVTLPDACTNEMNMIGISLILNAVPHDEMDMIGTGRILEVAPHMPHSNLDMFGAFMLEIDDDDSVTIVTPDVITIEGASDSMDLPLYFDTMFRFVTRFDDVTSGNNNDMSVFEYSLVSLHFPLIVPLTLTTYIHDVDDVRGPDDLLSDQSDFDSDSKEMKVTPVSMVEYPEWLANVVHVPKKDVKVIVYVDFQDLSKASPKDDFPLPHIDMLVDSTARHSMSSFMDGFSGYNKILMAPKDMEKTSFITE